MEDKIISLRLPEPEDIDFLYKIENNPLYWKYGETIIPFSKNFLSQYIFSNLENRIDSDKQVRFIISLKIEDKEIPIGTLDLFDYQIRNRNAQFGILIEKEFRKNEYGLMAMEKLLNYCQDYLGLHQIYCETGADNLNAIKLFSKIGFSQCGQKKEWLIRNEKFIDILCYQYIFKND